MCYLFIFFKGQFCAVAFPVVPTSLKPKFADWLCNNKTGIFHDGCARFQTLNLSNPAAEPGF